VPGGVAGVKRDGRIPTAILVFPGSDSALYLDSLRAAGGGPVAVMNGSATLVWIDPNAFTMVSSKEHSAYTRGVLSLNHSPLSFM
jgi:hypothetical protein